MNGIKGFDKKLESEFENVFDKQYSKSAARFQESG